MRILRSEALPLLVASACMAISLWVVQSFTLPEWAAYHANLSKANAVSKLASKEGLAALSTDCERKRESLEKICHGLPHNEMPAYELSGVLKMLIAQSREYGMAIDKVQPNGDDAAKRHDRIPVMLEMSGGYNSLGRFMAFLESMPTQVTVDRLAITAQKGQTVEARLIVSCFIQQAGK